MFRRIKTLSWLILALAVAHVVSLSDARAQFPDVPALGAKTGEKQAALPKPDELPPAVPLPAPDGVATKKAATKTRVPAPADIEIVPAAADPDGGDKNALGPLGPAIAKPGEPVPAPTNDTRVVDPLVIKPDQLPTGPQTIGLSVSVVAPEVMNVNHTGTIKILVKNTGVADARAVRVHYELPPELDLLSAQPEQKQLQPGDRALFWVLDTVAAGNEQMILLKVKATKVNPGIDHAALVTLVVGSRARTVIQEPLLKVEQTVTPSKLLQGQQARFSIFVSNPGSGPARNVVVRATLSSGLKADGEEIVEQTIAIIQPGQRIELDPLVVDTMAGGEQTCTLVATSTDVKQPADAKSVKSVLVLRPELNLTITGPDTRYTDTYADYKVTATNPGTAAAKDVRVTVTLPPGGGQLQKPLPAGVDWNSTKQTLTWIIPKIDPKLGDTPGTASTTFTVRLGGPGMYRVNAEARAGSLYEKTYAQTDVSGMADIEMSVSERRRVLDVGEETVFYIKIKNVGTKDAKDLLVTSVLSKNLKVKATSGTDAEAGEGKPGEVLFPKIDSLPRGRTLELGVKVTAVSAGVATCRVLLKHDDLPDASASIEDVAQTRITGAAAPVRK